MNTRTLAKLMAASANTWHKARAVHLVNEQNRLEFFKLVRDQRAIQDVPCKMAGEAGRAYVRRLQGAGWLH